MAIGNYDIGGMLARSGAVQGQQMGQAFSQLGQGIEGMLGGIAGGIAAREERKNAERAQQQFQQILAANQNDPNALRVKGQELMTSPDVNMQRIGKMLVDESVRLTGVQETQTEKDLTALQQKGELALFNMARMMQASPEEDISRSNLKRQNYLSVAEGYKVSPKRAMEILNESVTTKKPGDKYKVVGNRVFNTETGQYVEPSEAAELLPLGTIKDAVTPESLIEYIQTGDKDVLKAVVTEEQLDKNVVQDLLATDQVLETVDKALGLTDEYWVVGYDIAKMLPLPTDARQMETYVQTLRSNLAFDRLQKMRDRSKTGGALGQVSNIELKLLESSVAALDPGSKNFKQQLAEVRHQYENFRRSLLGLEPDSDRYFKENGKLYYDFNGEWIDLEEAAKENRFNLSPSPKTGGEL